jgi:CheY-like chemotaxis protein
MIQPIATLDATCASPAIKNCYACESMANRPAVIVLVDDEAAVRRFVRSILERAGNVVIEAPLAEDALREIEKQESLPDLLLTDIVMPGMNGIMLAAQAHKRWPGLHVLFMSGFAQDYAADLSGSVCLSKPFKAGELVAAVQSAIGASTEGSPVRSRLVLDPENRS